MKWFLLFFCVGAGTANVWEQFAIDGVSADTGYTSDVLDYIYKKYYHVMVDEPSRRNPGLPYDATWEEVHFYSMFVYIHLYPRFCNFGRIMRLRSVERVLASVLHGDFLVLSLGFCSDSPLSHLRKLTTIKKNNSGAKRRASPFGVFVHMSSRWPLGLPEQYLKWIGILVSIQ